MQHLELSVGFDSFVSNLNPAQNQQHVFIFKPNPFGSPFEYIWALSFRRNHNLQFCSSRVGRDGTFYM